MACCLFLLRLLAPLTSKLGIDATKAPRFPLVPTVVLGLVEIAGAWLVVNLHHTGSAADESMPSMGSMHHHMAGHDMSGHQMTASGPSASVMVLATLVGLALTGLGLRAARRITTPIALVGALAVAIAIPLSLRPAVADTHLLLMGLIELCLIVAPLAIVGSRAPEDDADDVFVVLRLALAAITAGAAVFLLITLHLPATHDWFRGADGPAWWLGPTLLLTGLVFWSSVLRFRLPPVLRTLLLVLVLETGAVIGLVLLVADHPIMAMDPRFGLGAIADQRLAGGLMMAVDLFVLAYLVDPQITGSTRTSVRPASRMSIAT